MRQTELTLDQMLADVIVQLVMRRDDVSEAEVRELMASLERHRSLSPDGISLEWPAAA